MRDDNKRPDGTTVLPWTRGKPMAWDVTVSNTRRLSRRQRSDATMRGAAAHKAAQNKIDKYDNLANTRLLSVCH